MKLIILTLAAALLSPARPAAPAQVLPGAQPSGARAEYRPDRASFRLRGAVRTVREEDYNLYSDGRGIFTGNLTLDFDRGGRLVRLLRGNQHVEDLYDDRYSYGADGRLAAVEHFFDRNFGSRDSYVYDDAKRTVKVLTYSREGRLVMRVTNTYDERGNQTRSEREFPGDADKAPPAMTVSYAYDEKGSVVSSTESDAEGRPVVVVTYTREADGRIVSVMKDLREAAQNSVARTVTTQDAAGEELSTESFAADGTPAVKISYARKFDARGNWVEEVTRTWEKGSSGYARESSFLRRRTITYF